MQAVLAEEVDITITSPASLRGVGARRQLWAISHTGTVCTPELPIVPNPCRMAISLRCCSVAMAERTVCRLTPKYCTSWFSEGKAVCTG